MHGHRPRLRYDSMTTVSQVPTLGRSAASLQSACGWLEVGLQSPCGRIAVVWKNSNSRFLTARDNSLRLQGWIRWRSKSCHGQEGSRSSVIGAIHRHWQTAPQLIHITQTTCLRDYCRILGEYSWKKSRFLLITQRWGIYTWQFSLKASERNTMSISSSEYFVKQCHYYNHIFIQKYKKKVLRMFWK